MTEMLQISVILFLTSMSVFFMARTIMIIQRFRYNDDGYGGRGKVGEA